MSNKTNFDESAARGYIITSGLCWRVWSIEHQAWWKGDAQGYTDEIKEAGHYTMAKAIEICRAANLYAGIQPNETMLLDEEEMEAILRVIKLRATA